MRRFGLLTAAVVSTCVILNVTVALAGGHGHGSHPSGGASKPSSHNNFASQFKSQVHKNRSNQGFIADPANMHQGGGSTVTKITDPVPKSKLFTDPTISTFTATATTTGPIVRDHSGPNIPQPTGRGSGHAVQPRNQYEEITSQGLTWSDLNPIHGFSAPPITVRDHRTDGTAGGYSWGNGPSGPANTLPSGPANTPRTGGK